ncbi:MAG: prepilin-type N-terminal cleavage/methylation domain-containing protein [Pontiella sp.]
MKLFSPSAKQGFTLLEILIALTVFAIAVTGMLAALSAHVKGVSLSEDHARAVRMAQREMNALRRMQYMPDSERTGEEGRYVWSTTVEEVDQGGLPGVDSDEFSNSRALRPYNMSVIVRWSDIEGGELKRRVWFEGIDLFQQR